MGRRSSLPPALWACLLGLAAGWRSVGALAEPARAAEVWPLPRRLQASGPAVQLSADFRIELIGGSAGQHSELLRLGIGRYAAIIANSSSARWPRAQNLPPSPQLQPQPQQPQQQPPPQQQQQQLAILRVLVTTDSEDLGSRTCYNYTMSVRPGGGGGGTTAEVSAVTPYGALYGLESFAQLVGPGGWLPGTSIELDDYPEYSFRGLMVDTGRRFWPLELLQSTVDAMASVKLNVLHLHFADNCRVAVESKVLPNLTASLTGPHSGFLSQDELRALVAYARLRGVSAAACRTTMLLSVPTTTPCHRSQCG